MIDLHTHTKYSDGTWTVRRLLKEAQKAGVEVLSITDHDNVKAYLELREFDYHKLFTGTIINGVELNVIYNGARIELLAYDFDIDKVDLWCKSNYHKKMSKKDRIKQFNDMVLSAQNHGIVIDETCYLPEDEWPVEAIYHEIKKHPENKDKFDINAWNSLSYFMICFVSDVNFPVYVNLKDFFPSIQDTVRVIREAKGKVFLAHAYKYPIVNLDAFLNNLINEHLIDGIEVYHSSFADNQSSHLYNYCIANNLLMCGGSDCHGEKDSLKKIGVGYNNININREIIDKWFI